MEGGERLLPTSAASTWLLECEAAARAALEAEWRAAAAEAACALARAGPRRAALLSPRLGAAQRTIEDVSLYIRMKQEAGYGRMKQEAGYGRMKQEAGYGRPAVGAVATHKTLLPIGSPDLDRSLELTRLRQKLSVLHRSMAETCEAAQTQQSSLGAARAELTAAKASLASVQRA